MAFDRDDIENHTGIFGISREEREAGRDDPALTEGREVAQKELENRFFNSPSDAYAIFQLKGGNELRDIRFEPMSWVQPIGRSVERGSYDLIYTARLTAAGSTIEKLNVLWDRFNNDQPADFRGHSLSEMNLISSTIIPTPPSGRSRLN